MRYFVVIPAFNEAKTLPDVLRSVLNVTKDIIVIDDGSNDATYDIAKSMGVLVYRHIINRGLGATLATGIHAALKHGAEIIVTFDADGQHLAADIVRIVEPIKENYADVVIGSRLLGRKNYMPIIRRLYNILGNLITYLLFGMKVSDSQSGLRAFNRHSAQLFNLRSNRMEVSSEFIHEIKKNKLRYKEIQIQSIYTKYSLSKGQSFFVGIKTLIKLLVLKILK